MTIDPPSVPSSADADADGVAAASSLFHSLSDPTRLRIVRRLTGGEARVADLVAQLGLAQSTVSAHVACLRDCGLVNGRAEGRQVFYRLARPELLELLSSAEAVMVATGNAVTLCPNYGQDSTPAEPHAAPQEGEPAKANAAPQTDAPGRRDE